MQTTDTVLAIYSERGFRGLPLERVYHQLLDPELMLRAYGKIYRNAGAMTKGSTEETVDGMSLQKIQNIIALLRQERHVWTPVRRVQIPKVNGKKRPLGIPTWSDKLVQEALRMLLEPYYERRFSPNSHGFRPEQGCHTALREIQRHWRGTVWFIEGDIKGCFDNIDHEIMLKIIQRDIHDGRLIQLIRGLLKAGYMEDWRYHETLGGTPQGGIISPLLSNIYLNELDRWVEDWLIPTYTRGERRQSNRTYTRLERELRKARKMGDTAMITQLKRERRTIRSLDPFDPDYRRLRYVRYADDFLLGFAGPRNEAEAIRDHIAEFLDCKLKLTLSKEKTLITHAGNEKAKFLGHEITITRDDTYISRNGRRSVNGAIALRVPRSTYQKLRSRLGSNGKMTHQTELINDDDYTIIMRYQSVLRGLYNYYCMAVNVSTRMNDIQHILWQSLTRTLACKHRIRIAQVYQRYRIIDPVSGMRILRVIRERGDKKPLIATFGGIPFVRDTKSVWTGNDDFQFKIAWFAPGNARTEVVQRLLASKCELCGAEGVPLQMHHIRRLADLNQPGRALKPRWMQIMSARKRKSLAVCEGCHRDIHAGRYDGPSPAKLTGEPDALKGASPVRRGAAGNVPHTR
jgi:group II intron reverse transcriptase/maturase